MERNSSPLLHCLGDDFFISRNKQIMGEKCSQFFQKKKKEEKKILIKIGTDFRSTLVSKAVFQVKDCVCVQVS